MNINKKEKIPENEDQKNNNNNNKKCFKKIFCCGRV